MCRAIVAADCTDTIFPTALVYVDVAYDTTAQSVAYNNSTLHG